MFIDQYIPLGESEYTGTMYKRRFRTILILPCIMSRPCMYFNALEISASWEGEGSTKGPQKRWSR